MVNNYFLTEINKNAIKKLDSKNLYFLQTVSKNLIYIYDFEISNERVFYPPEVDFDLNPNPKYLEKLEKIQKNDSQFVKFIKLLMVAGTDFSLLSIIFSGISTGLSHGTMDFIYRIGVSPKVEKVLDNLDIAVGSLQRRIIIADLINKILDSTLFTSIVSIAGGSCLLPIEGFYQSNMDSIMLLNLDSSKKAYEKACLTINSLKEQKNLKIDFIEINIISDELNIPRNNMSDKYLFECTGIWEYLSLRDRKRLLEKIYKILIDDEIFILTMLIENKQQKIFDAFGFKSISAQKIEDVIVEIKKYFFIDKIIRTPNSTYASFILRKRF